MRLYRAFLQSMGAIALLVLVLACKGKSHSSADGSVTVSGTISYVRVPLATDANGVPTGLADASVATNLVTLPARGVLIRAFQQVPQTQADGSTTTNWVFITSTSTSSTTDTPGQYSLTVPGGRATMIEVLSTFVGGASRFVNVVAEPGGINSSTPALDRLRYGIRKAVDGTAPAGNNAPNAVINGNTTLNVTVGLNDEWWLVNPSYNLGTGVSDSSVKSAVLETSISGRSAGLGSGSRILGIGDTLASFVYNYGNSTPGGTLDLHYWPGRTEAQGSYINYDTTAFPQAYDPSSNAFHYFGSIAAGPVNDDAWDEGVTLPMLGRNALYANGLGAIRTFAVPLNPYFPLGTALPNLVPDMALIEGLPDAMAANVLKSPYLADTKGTALASLKDIRDLSALTSAQKNPYSAPAVRAFAWQVILTANSLATPGVQANWSTINPLAAARFFVGPAGSTNGATDGTARDIEPLNIYTQITRLKESKLSTEPVDLAAVFTDAVLAPLGTPFGIPWPRPSTGSLAVFADDWGTDPTGALPVVPLTMAQATQVHGLYPNLTPGELVFAGFRLTADKRCVLSATISPALQAGSRIDVDLPKMNRTFSFTGSGGSTPVIIIPQFGNPPVYHPVRVWLRSPSALQPDVILTLTLTPSF